MGTSRATTDAYLGVVLELPDGRTVRCRALPLSRGVHWAQIQAWSRLTPANDHEARVQAEAQIAVMRDFPREVAPEDEPDAFESLMPGETFDLLDRFLAHRRTGVPERLNPERKTETP